MGASHDGQPLIHSKISRSTTAFYGGWGHNLPMPVFEYRCQDCQKRFSVLIGVVAGPEEAKCPNCGSMKSSRLISRFARGRSEDDRIDEMADQLETMGEPESPSEMRRMVREMGKAMDEDASEEMEDMFEADMAGEGAEE